MATLISPHINDIELGTPHRSSAVPNTAYGGDSNEEERNISLSSESCTRVVILRVEEVNDEKSVSSCGGCLAECTVDLERESGGDTVENGGVEKKKKKKVSVKLTKVERDCRICQLSIDGSGSGSGLESGLGIELGCSCKDDLGVAHKHCAEAWFKIKGNKICEICGSIARNVVGVHEVEQVEQWNEATESIAPITQPRTVESRRFWQGHKFLNFLLACMVFAFVISWLFRFNVPS